MHIIIDGYNYIFRMGSPGRKDLQKARDEFCSRLQGYVERKKVKLEVVFDSPESEYFPSLSSKDGLKIVFSPDADSYIRDIVEDSRNPASILVVSSDAEIIRDVKRNGAKVKSPSEFDMFLKKSFRRRKRELPDNEKPSPESIGEGEINAWLDEFSKRREGK